jgi:hypothetical protein
MNNDGGDVGAQFGEMDADGDGVLTKDEMVVYCATHDAMRGSLGLGNSGWADKIDSLFEEMDKDGSGGISLAEFTEWKNTQPESNKVYRIKSRTAARASKDPNSAGLGTLAAGDRVVALEEATDDSGRRLIRVEQGWIRATAVELDEAADAIVVQMASMDVGTDVGAAAAAAPVEAGTFETEDSKKAKYGDHHKAWVESERTVHTARKASPCSLRIVLACLLQAAFVYFFVVAMLVQFEICGELAQSVLGQVLFIYPFFVCCRGHR